MNIHTIWLSGAVILYLPVFYHTCKPASVDRLDGRLTGDLEVAGLTFARSATFFCGNLMKSFLWSFSPFR